MSIKYFCDKCDKELTDKRVEVIEDSQLKHYCPDSCFADARDTLVAVRDVIEFPVTE